MKPYIIRRLIAVACVSFWIVVSGRLLYLEVIYAVERYSGCMRRG